jgi:hypothetical protein
MLGVKWRKDFGQTFPMTTHMIDHFNERALEAIHKLFDSKRADVMDAFQIIKPGPTGFQNNILSINDDF